MDNISAVWQFGHSKLPDDGHLGPKYVVLKVKVKEKRNNLLHC
jgi:hypothetical protein